MQNQRDYIINNLEGGPELEAHLIPLGELLFPYDGDETWDLTDEQLEGTWEFEVQGIPHRLEVIPE